MAKKGATGWPTIAAIGAAGVALWWLLAARAGKAPDSLYDLPSPEEIRDRLIAVPPQYLYPFIGPRYLNPEWVERTGLTPGEAITGEMLTEQMESF